VKSNVDKATQRIQQLLPERKSNDGRSSAKEGLRIGPKRPKFPPFFIWVLVLHPYLPRLAAVPAPHHRNARQGKREADERERERWCGVARQQRRLPANKPLRTHARTLPFSFSSFPLLPPPAPPLPLHPCHFW
jgi:hypothetical protein